MNNKTLFLFLISLLVWLIPLNSQNNDPCGCNSVLAKGVFAERLWKSKNERESFFNKYNELEEFRITYNKSDKSGNLLTNNFSLAGATQNESHDETQRRFVSNVTNHFNNFEEQFEFERYGDKTIINKWAECKKDCVDNNGIAISYFQIDDLNYKIILKFNQPAGSRPLTLKKIITNGKVKNTTLPRGKNIKIKEGINEYSLTKQSPDETIIISFDFKRRPTKVITIHKNVPKIESDCVVNSVDKVLGLNGRDGGHPFSDVRCGESGRAELVFNGDVESFKINNTFGHEGWFKSANVTISNNKILFDWIGIGNIGEILPNPDLFEVTVIAQIRVCK